MPVQEEDVNVCIYYNLPVMNPLTEFSAKTPLSHNMCEQPDSDTI